MKRNFKHIVTLLLIAVLMLAPLNAFGAAAETKAEQPETRGTYSSPYEDWLCEADREKLLAFWSLVDEHTGISNGEAVFNTPFPTEWLDEIGGSEYGGTAVTPLIGIEPWYEEGTFDFNLSYELDHEYYPPDDPNDPVTCVLPELHGDLDLSGTKVLRVGNKLIEGPGHTTQIESVHLDGCEELQSVYLSYEAFCAEVSALDCPALWSFKVVNCAAKQIAFAPAGSEKAFAISTFGRGNIGCWYQNANDQLTSNLIAYPDAPFLGWYENGERVSTELEYARAEGGDLVACFGGDADGDGEITATDAILALRAAMHLSQSTEGDEMLDINGSGRIDMADAILILRFAMHLI